MLMPATSILLALVLVAPAVPGGGQLTPEEIIAERIEQIRQGNAPLVGSDTIASSVLVPAFYERRQFRPAWTSAATVDDLIRLIEDSENDGLTPADYHLAAIRRVRQEVRTAASAEAVANLDLLCSDALVRLVYHFRFGKVDPARLDPTWNMIVDLPGGIDPVTAMQQAIDSGRLFEIAGSYRPQHPAYVRLRQALAAYRTIERAGGWKPIPAGRPLEPGMIDPRVPLVRRRLAITGDLPESAARDTSTVYDAALGAAVKAFQERHALAVDGTAGPATLRAMNVPVGERIRTIRVNLERARWVMHDLPSRFVVVNIAGFMVYWVVDGQSIWESRVVVGKTATRTPTFRATMQYLVLNPTWTVPPGIMRREILPGMARDPHYLARHGLRMVNGQVIQPPGPSNALGRMKFMFPNPHNVYLHDTPAKELFDEPTRTFSHGCIRVEKPFELAELVLDDPVAWNEKALMDSVATGRTRTVFLARPLPVLVLYWTASVGRDNRLRFFPDVYHRDAAVARALDMPFSFSRRIRAHAAAAVKPS